MAVLLAAPVVVVAPAAMAAQTTQHPAQARVGTISRRQRRNRTHEQAGRLKINFQTACFDGLPTVFAAAAAFVRLRLTA